MWTVRSAWCVVSIPKSPIKPLEIVSAFLPIWMFPQIGVPGYPKMDDLQWKTLLKWMIWGYHYFRKHPYWLIQWEYISLFCTNVAKGASCGTSPKRPKKNPKGRLCVYPGLRFPGQAQALSMISWARHGLKSRQIESQSSSTPTSILIDTNLRGLFGGKLPATEWQLTGSTQCTSGQLHCNCARLAATQCLASTTWRGLAVGGQDKWFMHADAYMNPWKITNEWSRWLTWLGEVFRSATRMHCWSFQLMGMTYLAVLGHKHHFFFWGGVAEDVFYQHIE